jgi:hypothetical protein
MLRIHSLLVVILSCLLLSCSLVKTAYNKAPELTIWWLDDYFNFTPAQKSALTPSLQKLHKWHRQTQLNIYVTLLQDMQTSLAKEQISAAESCEKIDAIKSNIYTLQTESIPVILELAPLLSDKQLDYFKTKLAKRTEKWKADWWQETPEDQLEFRLEKTQDFAEKVYGNLTEAQEDILIQSLKKNYFDPALSYTEILRRNEDAFAILNTLQNKSLNLEEQSQLAKAGIERMQKSPNQAYQEYANNIAKHSCEMISNLHGSTNETQKLHAKNWLQDYILLLESLQTK